MTIPYDNPVNLFVARFLGTPSINLFDGSVKAGKLFIGGEEVLSVPGAEDGEVTVGIRPEGFILKKDGAFTCTLERVEVMGRDTSVVCTHTSSLNDNIRAIIPAEDAAGASGKQARFDLKPAKVLLFNPKTEERILFSAGEKQEAKA